MPPPAGPTEPPQFSSDPDWGSGSAPTTPFYTYGDFSLEVKQIDANYRLNGIAWGQVDLFQPFFPRSEPDKRLYKGIPDVDILLRGIKVSTPYLDTDVSPPVIKHREPAYSANPMALMHWFDRFYRGIPEDAIDQQAYLDAYEHCNEVITYRYGDSVPSDSIGSDGDYYARSDGRIYLKDNAKTPKWEDLGEFQGDYDWLKAQGDKQGNNGVYKMPRYECHLEILAGSDVEDVYERILGTCGGENARRYEKDGKIHYRVGVHRDHSLDVTQDDILEVGEFQPWLPIGERVNKLVARVRQSEGERLAAGCDSV